MAVTLTEREVEVLRLRDDEGLVWSEVAERIGTTKSAVNSSYRAAKRKLDGAPASEAQVTAGLANPPEAAMPEETAAALANANPFESL